MVMQTLSRFGEFHVEQTTENPNMTQFNQSIVQVEESLSIVNDLSNKLITKEPSMLDIFRVEQQPPQIRITSENWQTLREVSNNQILALKAKVDDLSTSMSSLENKTTQLNHTKKMLQTVDLMGADLAAMEELKFIKIGIAAVPNKNLRHLQVALSKYPVIIHRCYLTKETNFVCFAMPSKYNVDVEKILKTHHSEIFQIPKDLPHDVTLAQKEINNQLKIAAQKKKQIQSALKELGRENRNVLSGWKETTENILKLIKAERKILQSDRLSRINGFVPEKKLSNLMQRINTDLNGRAMVVEKEPAPAADPPTLVNHNRYVKPFEEITKLYGLPHYDELDPTPIIAITFPLIFGLMFGDIGHGLLLLIGGLTVGLLIKRGQAIKNVCYILAACGAGAIIAGLLFGEFFGIQLFTPLWFSPFSPPANVLKFLIFSLLVGVIQIVSGLILEMANFLIKQNFIDALLTSIPKIGFYVGAVYLVAVYQLNFAVWLNGPILLAIVPFVVLVFGKPFFMVAMQSSRPTGEPRSSRGSFSQRIFESGDLVTRLLSNTISYTRILALLMAHWALILSVYTVVGLIGMESVLNLILSGIIVVAGNIFVLALEGLVVFIHTMRLHFYEWFSKFFMGTGTEFTPFRQEFLYTQVELTEKKNQNNS